MGLEDSKEKSTPVEAKQIGKDENGVQCVETWSYLSVVGMMMYLASNSRPDIAYAVHSCARFSHSLKQSHEIAWKRIAQYLKKMRTPGMIVKPTNDLSIDLYADADFAGLWGAENPDDPVSNEEPYWFYHYFRWYTGIMAIQASDRDCAINTRK
jgi:hypothetical protein